MWQHEYAFMPRMWIAGWSRFTKRRQQITALGTRDNLETTCIKNHQLSFLANANALAWPLLPAPLPNPKKERKGTRTRIRSLLCTPIVYLRSMCRHSLFTCHAKLCILGFFCFQLFHNQQQYLLEGYTCHKSNCRAKKYLGKIENLWYESLAR